MTEISHIYKHASDSSLEQARRSLNSFYSRTDIGFKDLPQRIQLWEDCYRIGHKLASQFSSLVIVGVGGSSLGTVVISEVFSAKNIHFVDNVDSLSFEALFEELKDLSKTGWLFISKSGNTIETLCALEFVEQLYLHEGLSLGAHSAIISENKESSLTRWAATHSAPICQVPQDVGGRFSVLSPVGMLPAVFMGLDIEKFRLGAAKALQSQKLIESTMAQIMESFERQEWITLLWSYSSRMKTFGAWFQQLWAESLAKKTTKDGKPAPRASTPVAAIGACDQHSILQQVMEGTHDKFVIFQRFEDAEAGSLSLAKSQFPETSSLVNKTMGQLLKAEALATQEALNQVGVSTMTLKTKVLDEESLGFLFMFWQLVVAGLGEAMQIDAFNQPGVELGKRLAKEKLSKASLSE